MVSISSFRTFIWFGAGIDWVAFDTFIRNEILYGTMWQLHNVCVSWATSNIFILLGLFFSYSGDAKKAMQYIPLLFA